jgi:hypothetical protein
MKTPILSRLSNALFNEYNKLTEDEFTALDKECKSVSTTNCGWSEYEIANMIKYAVSYHIKEREQAENFEKECVI